MRLWLLAAGVLLPVVAGAERFDALKLLGGVPGPAESARPSVQPEAAAKPQAGRAKIPELSEETEEKLLAAIQGLTVILQRTPTGGVALSLYRSRAQAELSVAQRRILRAAGKELDATTKSHLQASQADVDRVLAAPEIQGDARGDVLFLRGLASSYLGDERGAVASFEEAIRVAPSSKHHGWMAYYVADSRYEAGDYRNAIALFRSSYGRMEPSLRLLALYRLAWSYLNLDDLQSARTHFIELIRKSESRPIQTDALRDLAFLVSRASTEPEILALADQLLATPALKLGFLRMIESNLENQGKLLGRSPVFLELLRIEPEPSRRIQLGTAVLSAARKTRPLVEGFAEFVALRSLLQREGASPEHPAFRANAQRIDVELQSLIKTNIEAFSGKFNSPEKVDRGQLSRNLRELFAFYQERFAASPLRPVVYGLWIDVCADLSDWECVHATSEAALAESSLPADFKRRALLERIAALEELVRKDSARYRPRLISAIDQALTDESLPEWARLATRRGELQLEAKDPEEAIRLFDRIYVRQKNAESFYRIQWARFQAGRYEDLLGDARASAFRAEANPKLLELQRESALKLAIRAREKRDLNAYSEAMRAFFAANPDPLKAALARKDHLSFLLERNLTAELFTELMKLPAKERYSPDFDPLVRGAAAAKLRAGDFAAAGQLLEPDTSLDPETRYMRALALLAAGREGDWESSLQSVEPERRDYLLSVLALLKPGFVLRYLGKANGDFRNLAARIQRGHWDPTLPGQQPPASALEREISSVRIPRMEATAPAPDAERKFARALQAAVRDVRAIRAKLTRMLAGRTAQEQLRAISAARDLESAIGQAILGSPRPAGLSPGQLQEYQAGLQSFASEFSQQAELLGPFLLKAQEAAKSEQDRAASLQMPQPARANWFWPPAWNAEPLSRAAALLDAGNAVGAMLLVDLLRGSALSSEEDYLRIRAGILLLAVPSDAMRRYVLQELISRGQSGLIEKWRKLT